jgi:hypothetical protein
MSTRRTLLRTTSRNPLPSSWRHSAATCDQRGSRLRSPTRRVNGSNGSEPSGLSPRPRAPWRRPSNSSKLISAPATVPAPQPSPRPTWPLSDSWRGGGSSRPQPPRHRPRCDRAARGLRHWSVIPPCRWTNPSGFSDESAARSGCGTTPIEPSKPTSTGSGVTCASWPDKTSSAVPPPGFGGSWSIWPWSDGSRRPPRTKLSTPCCSSIATASTPATACPPSPAAAPGRWPRAASP